MKRVTSLVLIAGLIAFMACQRTNNKQITNVADSTGLSWDTSDRTNDFYDDAETVNLPGPREITIEGEIGQSMKIDLSKLKKHSVIVKETILKSESDSFVGAYRYDGYSLYDILNEVVLKKKNESVFRPIIDLFVEVSNAAGEKVVLSWGEIYYPIHRNEILIATDVMRIVPSKTKELWTLPVKSRLIVSSDLVTARNISEPSKITIRSFPLDEVKVNKDMKPLFSPEFKIADGAKNLKVVREIPAEMTVQNYPAIFYGRGRGIHSTQPFKGVMIKDMLQPMFPLSNDRLQHGMFVAIAADGYRSVYTYSEVMNRDDQSELLLIAHPEEKEDAVFRLYPAMDFFSDRAVKALTEVRYTQF
jgi:hypothetical protein